ncbi:hypothetical protein BC827DRAFT_1166910 [Russula dissimulans]|nr:hypothetical protein BC827DRAFT_1166910 [Russula dissimulans]
MMFQPLALLGGVAFLSSAVNAAVYNVSVGSATANLTFSPNNITDVAVGDTINFLYLPKNHSVVQSSFATPCTPLDGGFKDSFHPATLNNDTPSFVSNFTVNTTKPIWFYCEQTEHCAQGMVFAINPGAPGSNNSFEDFLALALATANSSTNGTATGNGTASGTTTTTGAASTSTSKSNGVISLFVPGTSVIGGVIAFGVFAGISAM